jgi:hypothetical protein
MTTKAKSVFAWVLAGMSAACGDSGAGGGSTSASPNGGDGSGLDGSGGNGSGAGSEGGAAPGGNGAGGAPVQSGGSTPSYCSTDIENMQGGEGVTVTGFPACIGFATDAYEALSGVWLSEGATHEYAPNAGWNGGGAAHFTPPTVEGSTGLGQFHVGALGARHLSLRWLMKQGPTFGQHSDGNKTLLFVREPNDETHPRPMIITRERTLDAPSLVPGACDGTVCQYHVGPNSEPYFPDGSDTFWVGDGGYEGQWVSWEFEVDLDAQWIRLYLTTEDGVFNDTMYTQNDFLDDQSTDFDGYFNYIDVLGGYFAPGIQSDPGNWWEIDELVVSDQHIGPPEGFVR